MAFPKATKVIYRFHVQKLALDAVQGKEVLDRVPAEESTVERNTRCEVLPIQTKLVSKKILQMGWGFHIFVGQAKPTFK